MKSRNAVALLIETSNAYARGLLEGIIDYVRHHEEWSIYLPEQERAAAPPSWLPGWRGDGVIARIETDRIAELVRATGLPVVDVSAARHLPDIPWVETDDSVIAKLAFDHLHERGFRSFGYCGDPAFNWSQWRREHFTRLVREVGGECHVYTAAPHVGERESWTQERQRLAEWLRSLPQPIGIMACYDAKARQVLDVCRELNIAVPEQIAVIGVDNDRLQCELATPPLSSVIPNAHQTGFLAAELLTRMMSGKAVPAQAHLVKPLGVATRHSTDIFAIEDPQVAEALRFIREHATSGINVNDVLARIPLSRRILERRFRMLIGRTLHEEIMRLRIERVKTLLRETDLNLTEIARRVGFTHVEYLSVAFKRETGMTPRQYRKEQTEAVQPDAGDGWKA